MRKRSVPTVQPLSYPMVAVPDVCGIGLSRLYADARAGRLELKKSGRCTIVLRSELERYLASLPSDVGASPNPKARAAAAATAT